jgi:hypothetical protein
VEVGIGLYKLNDVPRLKIGRLGWPEAELLIDQAVNVAAVIPHGPIGATSVRRKIHPVLIRKTSRRSAANRFGRRANVGLAENGQEPLQRGQLSHSPSPPVLMVAKKGFDHFLVEQTDRAFPPSEPSIEVREEAEVSPHGSGPVSLLEKLRDVRLDMQAQWPGIQVSNGLEFSE